YNYPKPPPAAARRRSSDLRTVRRRCAHRRAVQRGEPVWRPIRRWNRHSGQWPGQVVRPPAPRDRPDPRGHGRLSLTPLRGDWATPKVEIFKRVRPLCMPRPFRIAYEGAIYHVTIRGNNEEVVFRDDQDYSAYSSNWREPSGATQSASWLTG